MILVHIFLLGLCTYNLCSRVLRASYSQVSRELGKETRHLKEEFQDSEPLPRVRLPRIHSATPIESRSSSALSAPNQPSRSVSVCEPTCQTCLFEPGNSQLRCRHFPCYLPQTYNSLGMFEKPQTYSVVGNYKQLLSRCKDLRPPTSKTRTVRQRPVVEENNDFDDASHAPRTTVKEKIRGLRQLVKEMKEKNEKTKPRDWAINYGDPVPRRFILKPVKSVC